MKKLKYAKYSGNGENCEESIQTTPLDVASTQSSPDNHNGNGHCEQKPQNDENPEDENGSAIVTSTHQTEPNTDTATTSQGASVPPVSSSAVSNLDTRKAELQRKLSYFIESLAERSNAALHKNAFEVNVNQQPSADIDKNVRPTSELLSRLQEALSLPPSRTAVDQPHTPPVQPAITLKPEQKFVNATIRIEGATFCASATGLNRSAALRGEDNDEIALSTYCTFEAIPIVESDDSNTIRRLTTFRTKQKTLSLKPDWDEEFELSLVDDVNSKTLPFTIQIWHVNKNAPDHPTAFGSATIDIRTLDEKLSSACSSYTVINAEGHNVGEIKIYVAMKEDYSTIASTVIPSASPSNGNVFCRTIERELSTMLQTTFEELEVISERLRTRLFDVTRECDDDFENDLNTVPSDEDDFEQTNKENATGLNWLEYCQNQASTNPRSRPSDE